MIYITLHNMGLFETLCFIRTNTRERWSIKDNVLVWSSFNYKNKRVFIAYRSGNIVK